MLSEPQILQSSRSVSVSELWRHIDRGHRAAGHSAGSWELCDDPVCAAAEELLQRTVTALPVSRSVSPERLERLVRG